ncbi:MAG: D-sedoheptulose 7-phosphate isomerase [Negativicutes bacterium]|nr:D-sedoheptulose 7-phosphate isomerase [Negativicutes bacterium]
MQDSLQPIVAMAGLCIAALEGGGRIFLCGNGGSAADCQHIAAELIGRVECERRPWPAMALTVDTSALTAIANDYGYDQVFARQAEGLVRRGDVLIGISTSGNSRSVIAALEQARRNGAWTVGMCGMKACVMDSSGLCDVLLKAPSLVTARIQEMHILVGHIVCGLIERHFTGLQSGQVIDGVQRPPAG